MGFKDEIKEFYPKVLDAQENEELEYITDEEAIAAINILNFMKYNKVPDAFLACAAYNLLNVYARQHNNLLSFKFHAHIHNILKGIEDIRQPKAIKVAYDNSEKLRLLIINFWDFQFSFGEIQFNKQIESLQRNKVLVWDGVRKQKCAAMIFNFVINSDWISNETLSGENLRCFIEKEILAFQNGSYEISNGRFIKNKQLKPANDQMDFNQKNYIRKQLFKCMDRPVILTAVYRRTWEKHITFVSVKPYIPNTKVITICDHINIFRKELEKVIDSNALKIGQRYFIIGYCEPYPGGNRMGVRLAINEGFIPIFSIQEYGKMPKDIFSRCHRFNVEEYLSESQKFLKL